MRRALIALCLGGFVLRAAFLVLEPAVERMGDEPSWLALAVSGLAELRHPLSPWSKHLLFYPPLYPYFLAVPYTLTGGHAVAQWLQVLLSVLLVPAVGCLGARCFSERTALTAAAFVAFLPELAWFAAHFWSETLFLTLLFFGLERATAAFDGRGVGAAVTSGVLLGLAGLTRETALGVVVLSAGWLAWPRGSHLPASGRARVVRGGVLLLAALFTVAPWTIRNWIVFRAFVPVATYGAFNLWLGNSDLDREEVYRLSDSVPGPVAQDRLAREEVRKAIARRQPTWLLEKLASELPRLFEASSEALVFLEHGAYGSAGAWARRAAAAAIVLPWLGLALLGIPGMALFPRRPPRDLLVAFFIYYVVVHVIAFGHHRFHLPLVPVLAIFAAASLRETSGSRRRLLVWIALLLGVGAALVPGILRLPSV